MPLLSDLDNFPEGKTHFLLSGPTGVLECVSQTPKLEAVPMTAVICHPHPQQGGTMHNKVVTTLERAFREKGMSTVRFNYRGVCKSEGTFDNAVGEIDDAMAVVDWVKKTKPDNLLLIAGFSFGAYIAASVAKQISPTQLITIAPAVDRYDFDGLGVLPCPWLVIQGALDEVVSVDDVRQWIKAQEETPDYIEFPRAGHFFHGDLITLRETLKDAVLM